jgi:hypothetical protein
MSDETLMCYISRCPRCDRLTFATVDSPENHRYVAKDVADVLRSGRTVDRMAFDEVRQQPWGCKCPPAPTKAEQRRTAALEKARANGWAVKE